MKQATCIAKQLLAIAAAAGLVHSASALETGDEAPAFDAPSTAGHPIKLSDFKGKWVVLYFYPKAFTPGCTREACSLRDGHAALAGLNAVVLGVSLDGLEQQEKFKTRYTLPFDLLSDASKTIATAYDVLAPSGLYARRVTFLVSPEGRIAAIIDSVDTAKHDRQVAEALKKLQEGAAPAAN